MYRSALTRRDSNPLLLPPERGPRTSVSPAKHGGSAALRLVTEAPESPANPVETPHDRAQTGHTVALEQLAEAALAYFASPTPELFEVCQAARAVVVAARGALMIDDLLLSVPPVADFGDYRRKLARKVAKRLLDQLEANGIEPELLAEIEEIFAESGMIWLKS